MSCWFWRPDRVLTFLDHTCGHGVLGGVIGSPFALRLPGILVDGDHLFSLFDGHLGLYLLSCLLQAEGEHTITCRLCVFGQVGLCWGL